MDGPFAGPLPYKVVSLDKCSRKGVVASSLNELIEKGKGKLQLDSESDVKVCLESDGTEVADNDYFQFLEPQTSLVLLLRDQEYIPPTFHLEAHDEPDAGHLELGIATKGQEIIKMILTDLTKIVTLSPDDIQILLDIDDAQLSRIFDPHYGTKTARKVKDACQRFLDEHQQAKECMSVLNLFKEAQKESLYKQPEPSEAATDSQSKSQHLGDESNVEQSGSKRKRVDNSES